MISTAPKTRPAADPNIEREFRIKLAMKQKGTSGRQIALKNGISAAMVTSTIQGRYASPRVRRLIAEAIGMEYSELWGD
jgi:lambda repressor-like predicted transcriptional regulator